MKSGCLRLRMIAIALFICLLAVGTGIGQEKTPATCVKTKVRERVARITRDSSG